MAEKIIKQWHLSVLRVQLDLNRPEPVVVVSLVGYEGSVPRTLWTQEHDPLAFGIREAGPPVRLELPLDVVGAVGRSFAEDLSEETALWLRLTPPYGYLGAAPWEQELIPVLSRPVLRVPDRLPVAADFGSAWRAVIAVAATPGNDWAAPYVESLVYALQSRVPGDLEVHVFADAATTGMLGNRPAAVPGWHQHVPEQVDAPSWSQWIRNGLGGTSVRSLHVVTDAAFDGDRPMLLLPPDPSRSDASAGRFVSIDGLLRLTDTMGAATLSFGSPVGNTSDVATRMLADGAGQNRPGPTLYCDVGADPEGWALASAYAYLADRQDHLEVPWDRSLFLYVQPEHVRASLLEAWPEPSAWTTTSAGDEVLPAMPTSLSALPEPTLAGESSARMADAPAVPAWVAASHRFLDSSWTQLVKSAPPGDVRDDLHSDYMEGATEALAELRDLVEEHGGV